jgi:hypothetical protein
VALSEGGIDINQYLDLIRAEKVMARHGIDPDAMLSQVKKFADVCYIKNIDIQEFASLFNRFREFLLSASKGEHPDTINFGSTCSLTCATRLMQCSIQFCVCANKIKS